MARKRALGNKKPGEVAKATFPFRNWEQVVEYGTRLST